MKQSTRYPTTPDGRYFVVRGRLWRCSNPHLPEAERQQLVRQLMDARRDLRGAKDKSATGVREARGRVQAAKEGLGERGAVWWTDGARDWNRTLAKNSPYRDWYDALPAQDRGG